jgi:hypothetical protein
MSLHVTELVVRLSDGWHGEDWFTGEHPCEAELGDARRLLVWARTPNRRRLRMRRVSAHGDASSGPGGCRWTRGGRGPGGGPGASVVRGPDHDPCTYCSLSAHDLWPARLVLVPGQRRPARATARRLLRQRSVRALGALPTARPTSAVTCLVWWPVGGRPPRCADRRCASGPATPCRSRSWPSRGAPTGERAAVHHPAADVAVGRPSGLVIRCRRRHRSRASSASPPRARRSD